MRKSPFEMGINVKGDRFPTLNLLKRLFEQ